MEPAAETSGGRFLTALTDMAEKGELAAVVVHMNDTYAHGERWVSGRLACPGFARIAAFADRVRAILADHGLADRLLLAHAGDFLSPSYLSNQRKSHGAHMVELFNALGVTHVTLGNHEFDHDRKGKADILLGMLGPGRVPFEVVTSNLQHPNFAARPVSYWPETSPFAAILGLAGKATTHDAEKHGFSTTPWQDVLEPLVDEIVADGRASLLLVMSHCDNLEDRALLKAINQIWRPHGVALIVGGHDHHVDWTVQRSLSLMVKNPSNLSTITATLVPKWVVARPNSAFECPIDPHGSFEEEMRIAAGEDIDDVFPKATDAEFEDAIAVLSHAVRTQSASYRPPDFIESFCKYFDGIAREEKPSILEELQYKGALPLLYDRALTYGQADFVSGGLADRKQKTPSQTLVWRLPARDFEAWEPEPSLNAIVSKWTALADAGVAKTVWTKAPEGAALDALDRSLRFQSTNFGNFVADCVSAHFQCAVALLHSGSFRSDMEIGTPLNLSDVRETFTYDAENALIRLRLTTSDVNTLIAHGCAAAGTGAFPQVSAGATTLGEDPEAEINVVLPRYLMADDHDGYRSVLLRTRNMTEAQLDRDITDAPSAGVIACILSSAEEVTYDESVRVTAALSQSVLQQWMRNFFVRAAQFDDVCAALGVERFPDLLFEEKCKAPEWRKARDNLANIVWRICVDPDLVENQRVHSRFQEVYRLVEDSEEQARGPISYTKLLDDFFSQLFVILRNQDADQKSS